MVLLVIEGTDGSGKATQVELLKQHLTKEGHNVETVAFPRHGNKSAALVDQYLNGEFGDAKTVGPYRGSIFYAIDRYAASFEIRKWLAEGKVVICDRYVSANMGHQAGKISDPKERKKLIDWLENLEYGVFDLPKPDKTILLFMPPEIGQQLIEKKAQRDYIAKGNKDIHEADITHLKEAANAFREVAQDKRWDIIDCAPNSRLLSKEAIHEMVYSTIKQIL